MLLYLQLLQSPSCGASVLSYMTFTKFYYYNILALQHSILFMTCHYNALGLTYVKYLFVHFL